MTRDEAVDTLQIEIPTTANALKAVFRRRASEEHPDHSKHPKANERFRLVQEAFELLKGDSTVLVDAPAEARLDDGGSLEECGLGLGPTTNGRPCPSCHGRGYGTVHNDYVTCPDCQYPSLGKQMFRCRRCSGTGRFVRNGRDVGVCFACSGLGWKVTSYPPYDYCPTCHGLGRVPTKRVSYYRCTECKGTGEIVVLNPVLPKGLFAARANGG
jgi:DnaJ-class molecular chaperone